MRFWQYFDMGEGMFYPYTNVLFKSGVEISLHYVWASKDRPVVPEVPISTKRREDRSLCPNKQKTLLWQYFIDGERRGKKKTPEEVHMLLRKDLQPQDYVTPQKIKSLFSRWTRQKSSVLPKLSVLVMILMKM